MVFHFHYIDDTEIVGYGPLLVTKGSTVVTEQLYRPRQLHFLIYLRHYAVEIKSDPFQLGMEGSEQVDHAKDLTYFKNDYFRLIKLLDVILSKK